MEDAECPDAPLEVEVAVGDLVTASALVIVGVGLSAAFLAKFMVQKRRPVEVVVVVESAACILGSSIIVLPPMIRS